MKFNSFFLMTAVAITMTSTMVKAEDEAVADAIWTGRVGDSIPSSNLIITGINAGDIEKGILYIEKDGRFTSSEVILEGRDYDPDTQLIGDRQLATTWTYVGSQVLVGNQVTQDANITLHDSNTQTFLTQGQIGQVTGGYLKLSVKNDTAITDVPVEGDAQVIVQMAASYVEAL